MITVGIWNLENLFLPGDESGRPLDEETYDSKLNALATTISGLEVDVLAVQEVGDPEAQSDLVAQLDVTGTRSCRTIRTAAASGSRSFLGCLSTTASRSLSSRRSCGQYLRATATR